MIYFPPCGRSKLPETPRYTVDVVQDANRAAKNMATVMENGTTWEDDVYVDKDLDRWGPVSCVDAQAWVFVAVHEEAGRCQRAHALGMKLRQDPVLVMLLTESSKPHQIKF
jgi:hypothetical protein